ncbi:MAG: phosphatidate cytidylyltransferase [Planctomycetes bacterium]|nr:phosphatidate cytidylyltransferase [Planctomycetota bacterium]
MKFDYALLGLIIGIVGLLSAGTLLGVRLSKRDLSDGGRKTVDNLNARMRGWWMMSLVFGLALSMGETGTVLLFCLVSFLALREFITLTPTRLGDHRALFWAFFFVTPMQYYLLWIQWYPLFTIFIPVYAFLLLPIRTAVAGETERFLERISKIQWGLMICVYCCSHAPGILLLLDIPSYSGQNSKLLLFFVLICELSDVMQYVFGKTMGRRAVAPTVSPGKTWEGLIGGCLWWATPFSFLQAAGMSLAITLSGFGGGLVMSAIKRDRGVKDWGQSIEGHGGVLDRIDSLCFSAPMFFHLTRYYFTA